MAQMDAGRLVAALRAPAAVFGNPDLRRVEIAWAGTSFTTWSFAIALAVYAFDVGGATAVGLVALIRLLPGAFAAPFAGLLGDAHSRRAVLIASAGATAVTLATAAAAAWTGGPSAIVFCTAAAFAIATSAYIPAMSALLPVAARTPQELSAANVALSVMDNAGFLLGAIGAGLLLAIRGPELAFGLAAAVAAATALVLIRLTPDDRPDYVDQPRLSQVARQTMSGASTILADRGLRLLVATLTVLVFFEGAIDVLIVVAALQLLELGSSSVGYLNAAWGVGALAAGGAVAVLLERGKLALGIGVGSLTIGAAAAVFAGWPVPAIAFAAQAAFGVGYVLVEVATRTFMQRLGSDEVLGRVFGFLEASRLAAMALGSIAAPLLVALLGTRGALIAAGALVPLFAALRWGSLRDFETGAPVDRHRYALLRDNAIFQPLPVATLERLCHDLEPIEVGEGAEVITEGQAGDLFYLIEEGEVSVTANGRFRGLERDGESFGEIALIRDVPRAATVRATCPTRLLTLTRHQFIAAVTGYPRSTQVTENVIDTRLASDAAGRR